jgi:hypothetical protein
MGINGKLELVCAHKYGYYEQVMTQFAFSEEKSDSLIIWIELNWKQLFETIVVTEILTGHLKTAWLEHLWECWHNFDETIKEKKEDHDDSFSNSSSGK